MVGGMVQETTIACSLLCYSYIETGQSSHTASDTCGNAATHPERHVGRRDRVSVHDQD